MLKRVVHCAQAGLISRASILFTRMLQTVRTVLKLSVPRISVNNGCSRLLCSSYNKDIAKQSTPVVPDILLQNLKHAKSVQNLLEMVGAHRKIMNSKHILQALRSIFTLQKQRNSDMSVQQILKHPNFERLCFQLKTKAGIIETNETVEALKIVTFLGVRSDSTIVQVLLQLIRHNLNNLSLGHIIFTDFLLSQHKSTPMIEALKMALPIVFEIHCQKKMDREDVLHLAEYLYFAAKHNLSEICVEDIVNAIMQCKEPLDPKTAKSIVWSITDLPEYNFLEPLLEKALSTIAIGIDSLEFVDVETTLTKVLQRVRKRNHFYDEAFVDACINFTIDKNIGYTESIYLARKITRLAHFNKYLLDHISQKVHENHNLILKGNPTETYTLINSLSLTEIRPVHWDSLKNTLTKDENIAKSDKKAIYWLKLGCSLCLLDIFRSDILELCLREDYLRQIFSKKTKIDFVLYLALCQCIKLYRSDLLSLIPKSLSPERIVQELKRPSEYPLESSLYVAFGGEKYVKTNMMSKTGTLIDHVVVFRSGGYPVAIDNEKAEFIEDISLSRDHQIVAIIGLTEHDLTINTRHLKSVTAVRLKSLESEGYSAVAIDLDLWSNLPDFEKIPYVTQAIKDKSHVDFSVSVDVGG